MGEPDGGPAEAVDLSQFELLRALTGRRSTAQIARYEWTCDPGPFLAAFEPGTFTTRTTDLVEWPSGRYPRATNVRGGMAVRRNGRERWRSSRRRAAGLAAALLLLTACGGGGGDGSGNPDPDPLAVDTTAPPLAACPAEGHIDTLGVRSLLPNEIARLPITYTFLHVAADGCTPARFNPCEPVHYIQNGAAAPPFVVDNVREAFRRLSQATGITFVDDGLTDESARRGPYVPERYPGRWAPILVVWEHFPAEQTSGEQQILGNTVPMRVGDVTVSARLRFNVDAYNDESTKEPIGDGFGPPAGSGTGPIGRNNITWGRIVLHELAHVAGLGHTREEGSVMYPDAAQQTIRPTGFSRSDLAGLRYLGREAGCIASPPEPSG